MHIWGELGKRYLSYVGIEAKPGLAKLLLPMSLDESSEYLKEAYQLSDSVENGKNFLLPVRHYILQDLPDRQVLLYLPCCRCLRFGTRLSIYQHR